MQSISLTLMLLTALLVSGGCKHRRGEIASTAFAGDPAFAGHFTSGFYDIEANAWRWTNKEFAVTLNPPLHAEERGAQLLIDRTAALATAASGGDADKIKAAVQDTGKACKGCHDKFRVKD